MDLLILDKIIMVLIHKIVADTAIQFSVIAGLGVFIGALLPDKKNKGGKK